MGFSTKVQEINFLGPLKVNMNIVYFYMNFFSFYEKFFPLLTMHAFFQNILPHYNTHDIFYWFLSVNIQNYANKINCSFTKRACKFVIKTWRDSSTETFLGVTKGTECLQRSIFDRLRFLDFDSEWGERVWEVRGERVRPSERVILT